MVVTYTHYGCDVHKYGLHDTGNKRRLWPSEISRIKPEPFSV